MTSQVPESRFALDRRAVLRGGAAGVAAAVALPPLEAMFDGHGTAHADGRPIPRRLGVWFWGNGVRPDRWVPKTEGPDWLPSEELEPLARPALRPYLTVVSGMNVPIHGTAHHVGRSAMLTGTFEMRGGTYGRPAGPSLDQIAANAWTGRTAFHSLQLGVSRRAHGGNNVHLAQGSTSFASDGQALRCEFSAAQLYRRVFGSFLAAKDPRLAQELLVRRGVVDLVSASARTLEARVGSADRHRLRAHLEGLRALETSMNPQTLRGCPVPAAPEDPQEDFVREPLEPHNRLMSDLLVLALACDLTRAFSYQYTAMQADTIFWQVGATEGSHVLTHDDRRDPSGKQPSQPEKVHRVVRFVMGELAVLLDKLRMVPQGAGTLLDSCCILATSEVNNGSSHTVNDMPIVLAGRAGGALRAGTHHRSQTGESTSKVALTCLRACGVAVPTFGSGDGRVSAGVSAIEA